MYTEYNSDNVSNQIYGNPNDYKEEKPNKFLSMIWKILLVIIILIVGFMLCGASYGGITSTNSAFINSFS